MITRELLAEANKGIPTVSIKGKEYIMVKDRIKRFRDIMPDGSIMTEVIDLTSDTVTIKATVTDPEGRILATGIAHEIEGSSNINRTSHVENCETSAIGRALGVMGIGIDDSLGSADEVANAIQNQQYATDREKQVFIKRCEHLGQDPQDILRKVGWQSGRMTTEQHGKALIVLKEIEEGANA